MADPMNDIEDEKAQTDLGRLMYRVYKGAILEGASIAEAMLMCAAFVRGSVEGSENEDGEKEKES